MHSYTKIYTQTHILIQKHLNSNTQKQKSTKAYRHAPRSKTLKKHKGKQK